MKGNNILLNTSLTIIAIVFILIVGLGVYMVFAQYESPLILFRAWTDSPVVCNNVLPYRVNIIYRTTPVVTISVRSVIDEKTGYTVIWDTHPRYTTITNPIAIERDSSYLITEKLPAGDYLLVLSLQARTTEPVVAKVPFVIPEKCP